MASIPMQRALLNFLFLILLFISICKAQEISTDPSYYYNLCGTSTCNNISLSYPFALPSFCHNPLVSFSCPGDGYLHVVNPRQTGTYRVLGNITTESTGSTLCVASDSLFGCGQVSHPNFITDPSIFSLPSPYTYGTHLNCTRPPSSAETLEPVSCLECDGDTRGNTCYYSRGFVSFAECEPFFMFTPIGFNVTTVKNLRGYLRRGYMIRYSRDATCQSCQLSGGRCGSSPAASFVCFCARSVHRTNCSDGMIEDLNTWIPGHRNNRSTILVAALSSSAVLVVITSIAAMACLFASRRKSKSLLDSENPTTERSMTQVGLEDLVSGMSTTRYSYSQVKKFTNNFSSKLGEGGFGTIYKGIIPENNGNVPVAVKLLKRSKQSEKQFMNEVATIGRIHHHNLLRLLGYCAQGKKRVLVFEFMENGSLEKYLYKTKKSGEDGEHSNFKCLNPKQKYTIALETAKGIQYLHQGCRSRILHCDIKPHNILLDSNLSAKVSDFGLARMIDKDYSHVSLTNAQGTPGYTAPEVWSKSYGPVTEKSDVYSYGMLILEMAVGRKNYDWDLAVSSQLYFTEWTHQHAETDELEMRMEQRDFNETVTGEGEGDEEETIKKMCLVGLWCIQHIPSDRPTMTKVIQMLEGSVEIETPPNPFPHHSGEAHSGNLAASTVYLSALEETGDPKH